MTTKPWSSLFSSKSRNVGKFTPVEFEMVYAGDVIVPPKEVMDEGIKIWKDYLIGFFLDQPLSSTSVKEQLKRFWRLKGTIEMKSDGTLFFFNFSRAEDHRERILHANPLILKGKMFIITQWSPTILIAQEQIKAVPIWVHLSNIPPPLWSHLGINWLACRLGRMICMDESMEKLQGFRFAKVLIEITPAFTKPKSFPVKAMVGEDPIVYVSYDWVPEICNQCNVFGHTNCIIPNDTLVVLAESHRVGAHNDISKHEIVEQMNVEKKTWTLAGKKSDAIIHEGNTKFKKQWRLKKDVSRTDVKLKNSYEVLEKDTKTLEDGYIEKIDNL